MMLKLLHGVEDVRVDDLALGVLEQQLAGAEAPFWVRDLLWTVLARWGDARPEARLEELDTDSWSVTSDQMRQIWSDGKLELDIPDVPPIDLEAD